MIILLNGKFILRAMHLILSAWALSCFWCLETGEYCRSADMSLLSQVLLSWGITEMIKIRMTRSDTSDRNLLSWDQQHSITFKEFWAPIVTSRPTVRCTECYGENLQIQKATVRKLIATSQLLIFQNEPNKQHFILSDAWHTRRMKVAQCDDRYIPKLIKNEISSSPIATFIWVLDFG